MEPNPNIPQNPSPAPAQHLPQNPPQNLQEKPSETTPVKPDVRKILRTYELDTAHVLQKKNASVVKMAVAESKKKENAEVLRTYIPPKKTAKSLMWIFLCLIFFGLGGGVIYYLYQADLLTFNSNKEPAAPVKITESLIDADVQKEINISAQQNIFEAILHERTNSSLSAGQIEHIVFTQGTGETKEITAAETFLRIVSSEAPDMLLRSLSPEFMYGFHQTSGNEPFLVLKAESFQSGFAGMLAWEKTMFDDVNRIFTPIEPPVEAITVTAPAVASTTSTTTTADILEPKASFEDVVIRNRDVRVLRSTYNEIMLLYAFIDPQTIVIATSASTLQELLERVEKRIYVR